MPITLEQAKNLKFDDRVVVSRTGEVWTVTGIAPVDNAKKVSILINNGRTNSSFDESRLHLFDLYETPPAPSKLPSAEEAADKLRPGMEAAYKEFQTQEELKAAAKDTVEKASEEIDPNAASDDVAERIEHSITDEKELTKPAHKPKSKTKGKPK